MPFPGFEALEDFGKSGVLLKNGPALKIEADAGVKSTIPRRLQLPAGNEYP
jgi:hypothetical protein